MLAAALVAVLVAVAQSTGVQVRMWQWGSCIYWRNSAAAHKRAELRSHSPGVDRPADQEEVYEREHVPCLHPLQEVHRHGQEEWAAGAGARDHDQACGAAATGATAAAAATAGPR